MAEMSMIYMQINKNRNSINAVSIFLLKTYNYNPCFTIKIRVCKLKTENLQIPPCQNREIMLQYEYMVQLADFCFGLLLTGRMIK